MKRAFILLACILLFAACTTNTLQKSILGGWQSLGVMPVNKKIDSGSETGYAFANVAAMFGPQTITFRSDSFLGDNRPVGLYHIKGNRITLSSFAIHDSSETYAIRMAGDSLLLVDSAKYYAMVFQKKK